VPKSDILAKLDDGIIFISSALLDPKPGSLDEHSSSEAHPRLLVIREEWDVSGLHEAPSRTVKPSRVAESVFNIEGKVVDIPQVDQQAATSPSQYDYNLH
jgi:hypothetical protein